MYFMQVKQLDKQRYDSSSIYITGGVIYGLDR